MARIRRATLAVLLAALVPLGAGCVERGAASAQAVAEAYLSAARSGDLSALVALTPADFDADADARAKIAAYALVRDANFQIELRPNDITPNELGAEFRVDGGTFKDAIRMQRIDGRWFAMLGRARNGPTLPTAQATR